MAKNSLFSAIQYLDQNELDKFEKYLQSPYFNTRPVLLKAFRFIRKNLSNSITDKKALHKNLFASKNYSDTNIRKIISDLNKLCGDFLGQQGINNKDKGLKFIRMMEMMQEKGMLESFNSAYSTYIKKHSDNFTSDDAVYLDNYRAEILKFYSDYNKINSDAGKSLVKASRNLNLMFVYSKLHLYRDILLYDNLPGEKIDFENAFFNETIKYIENDLISIQTEHPSLYIIYLVIKMTLESDNSHYSEELRTFLVKNEKKLKKNDLTSAYNYLISFYWININKGNTKFYSALFDCYKFSEKHGILKIDRYIPHHVANSIIIAGIFMQEFSWLEYFLEKYKKEFEPDFADDVYNLSLAKLNFSRGRYAETLKNLNKISLKNPAYFLNSKILLLKALYEMGDIEGTRYIVDSIKHYISRSRNLNQQHAVMNKNFIKFFLLLLQLRTGKKISPQKVIDMMDDTKSYIPNRNWLTEKISEVSV